MAFLCAHAPHAFTLSSRHGKQVHVYNWCLERFGTDRLLQLHYIANIRQHAYRHNPEGRWMLYSGRVWFADPRDAMLFRLSWP